MKLNILGLKCEQFSASIVTQTFKGAYPLEDGALVAEVNGLGKIDARFTGPDAVQGRVHVLYKPPLSSGECDMGEADWIGTLMEKKAGEAAPTAPATGSEETPEMDAGPGITQPVIKPLQPAPQVARTVIPQGDNVLVVNDRIVQSNKKVILLGEVENQSKETLHSMRVQARLLGAGGKALAEKTIGAATNSCAPGERTPFVAGFDEPAGFSGYSLQVTAKFAKAGVVEFLKITESKLAGPWTHIIGLAEVVGDQTVEYPSVIGVYYDEEGKVIGLAETFLAAPGAILAPGDKRPFSIGPVLGQESEKFRLLVDHGMVNQPKPAELEILDAQLADGQLKGKVRNTTTTKAGYPFVHAAFYDASGKLLDVQATPLDPFGDLAPGGEAAFLFMALPEGIERFELFASYDPAQ